jgi:multidrug transporter EmrE-like cation transporter
MSFDAWVVGFGISTLLRQLHLADAATSYAVFAGVGLIDIVLLYRFFRKQRQTDQPLSESSLAPAPN